MKYKEKERVDRTKEKQLETYKIQLSEDIVISRGSKRAT